MTPPGLEPAVTEAAFVRATRESYDLVVADYVDKVSKGAPADRWPVGSDALIHPLDRSLWGVFTEWVQAAGNLPVADIGCGPGIVTKALYDLGLDVFGVDLSPEMVALARGRYPGVRFDVGSMLALDLPDGVLGGLVASYSIIHVPWEHRPEVFAEFARVLAPGGQLLMAFQVGQERRRFDEMDGLAIALDWYRQRPTEVAGLLVEAGFEVRLRVVRQADEPGKPRHGYVLAQKPSLDRATPHNP